MNKTLKTRYRVHFWESERGWGQDHWHTDYATRDDAEAAIARCHKINKDDWELTHTVPDTYVTCNNEIEVIEVDRDDP